MTLHVPPLPRLQQTLSTDNGRSAGHFVNISRTKKQIETAQQRIRDGENKFVIRTPERLQRTDISELQDVISFAESNIR